MDQYALAILKDAETWKWPITHRIQESGKQGGTHKALTPKLLHYLILESQALGGTVLDQFWFQVGECHPILKRNVEKFKVTPNIVSPEKALFEGVNRAEVNFTPIFTMAAEFFTHLGVAFLNPGGRKSGVGTPFSVSDIVRKATNDLLRIAEEEGGFGARKQEALKVLAMRRDGTSCPMTGVPFNQSPTDRNFDAVLAHVVPNSVHGKAETLACIAMFAGISTIKLIHKHLNGLGNTMNLQLDAHKSFDDLKWGIEALVDKGVVKYIFRNVPSASGKGPGYISILDGGGILFQAGPEGKQLEGPNPMLCNLHLAVARVLHMSGAAEVIMKMKEDADDSDYPQSYVASMEFCDTLDAKLLLTGLCTS